MEIKLIIFIKDQKERNSQVNARCLSFIKLLHSKFIFIYLKFINFECIISGGLKMIKKYII